MAAFSWVYFAEHELKSFWIIRKVYTKQGYRGQMSLGNVVCSIPLWNVKLVHQTLRNSAVHQCIPHCLFQTYLTKTCFSPVNISPNISPNVPQNTVWKKLPQNYFLHGRRACGPSKGGPGGDYWAISTLCQAEKCPYNWLQLYFLYS